MPLAPALERALPRVVVGAQRARALREQRAHLVGNQERRRFGPAQGALGARDFVGTQGLAVRRWLVLLGRRAGGDVAPGDDETRPIVRGDGARDRGLDLGPVVGIGAVDVPAVGLEAAPDVLAEGERGITLDRDVV